MTLILSPRAILFDLDDTLLDDTGDLGRLWRDVTAEAACQLDAIDGEVLLAAVERIRTWYWSDADRHREGRQDLNTATRRIVRQAFAGLGLHREALADWVADEYRARRNAALRVFPETVETLEALRRRGVRTALLTNGAAAAQRAKIERFDLARHFDRIFIEGELEHGKPHPSVYRAALGALDAPAGQSWMVGDNLEWDVAAPQRLGVCGIWIDRRGGGIPPEATVTPDRIIRHLGELLED